MTSTAQTLSCLIVGCGNIAGGFDEARPADQMPLSHAGAYTRHGHFRILACVEPVGERRLSFMRRWGVPQGYADISEIEGCVGNFDVISICSSTGSHVSDVNVAIALRPKVIFCEKPLAPTLAEAIKLVEACHVARIPLVVNYTRRWDPDLQELASDLNNGRWGKVRAVSGVYNKGVLNNGSHMIDLLHFLFGRLAVVDAGPVKPDGMPGDPSIPACLKTQDQVPVQLSCTDARDFSLFEMQIMTEKAVISMEDGGMNWRVRIAVESDIFPGYRSLGPDSRKPGRLPQATLAAVSEIYDALFFDRSLSSTGENALEAQSICEAIRVRAENKITI